MDLIYSGSLLISLVAGGLGLAVGLLVTIGQPRPFFLRAGLAIVSAALACLGISVGVHWFWGHGAGSLEPMGTAAFSSSHPAFGVGALLAAAGLTLVLRARRRAATFDRP